MHGTELLYASRRWSVMFGSEPALIISLDIWKKEFRAFTSPGVTSSTQANSPDKVACVKGIGLSSWHPSIALIETEAAG